MSKWLEKALAAVAADKAVSDPVLPDVNRANCANCAKTPLVQRPEEKDSQQHPPKPSFGTIGTIDTYGKWQNESGSHLVGLPRYWKKAFDALAATPCPSYVAPKRWQQLLADADKLRVWAPMLAAMDWTLPDVLGRERIDHLSLVWVAVNGELTASALTTRRWRDRRRRGVHQAVGLANVCSSPNSGLSADLA